jgi:hypothetical protein
MQKLLTFIFPAALLLMIFACDATQHKAKWEPSIAHATLTDSLPPSLLLNVNSHQLQGYHVTHAPGSSTYYFEYEANHQALLRELSQLPFAIDSAQADVQCRLISESKVIESIKKSFQETLVARHFFLEKDFDNYTFYECVKLPQHHYLLLDKHSDRVLHVIQQV